MLYYIKNNESYLDANGLASLLKIHRSKLKTILSKHKMNPKDDYIIYNNRFLFKEDAVVRLISSMAENNSLNENTEKCNK